MHPRLPPFPVTFSARRLPYVCCVAFLFLCAQAVADATVVGPVRERSGGQEAPDAAALKLRAEHFDRLGVGRWHLAGLRGKGVKVAVLDSGFRGYRDHLGKALPDQVSAKSFRRDADLEAKDSQHGILCAEVLHAIAPDAELLLANWEPDDPQTFVEAVRWARERGARVISCSVIMPSWSDGEGGGPVHAELAKALGKGDQAGDVLLFACAGNIAQRHWSGPFRDAGGGWHEWKPGVKDNGLTPWGAEQASVEVCWKAGGNYDVYVCDRETGAAVASSVARDREERTCAVARFQPQARQSYAVRVQRTKGEPGPFHLFALHTALEHSTAPGSVCFPADGPAVVAVGAVDRDDRRLGYSSCGPNSSCPKPDLVAPVPFPSAWRPKPFSGTSAAAPQAAALAALWLAGHPGWTAGEVKKAMSATARDLLAKGHDCETGYGLIQLPRELLPPRKGP